ncbi:MAG: DUF3419 family protein [Flavisolibacter sp.]
MIYYSHINEDNRVERELFRLSGCNTVVAIGGSGERVLSLMDLPGCKRVMVVDCNSEALKLLQLKLAALRALTVQDYLRFLGHYTCPAEERLRLFAGVKKYIIDNDVSFWEAHKHYFTKGVLYAGYFEKFLNRIRPLSTAYLGKNFRVIFETGYNKDHFPERRWTILRSLFSHPQVYKIAGNRDPAFVGENADTRLIPTALDETIRRNKARGSFMAHLVFRGTLRYMNDEDLPPSLRHEVLDAIKERLIRDDLQIDFYPVDLLEFLKTERQDPGQTFYSLSDILSFADFNYLEEVVQRTAVHGNIIMGRSFLRNRLTVRQLEALKIYGTVQVHSEQESTGMYQVFSLKPF